MRDAKLPECLKRTWNKDGINHAIDICILLLMTKVSTLTAR